jgi:hypothetical protein
VYGGRCDDFGVNDWIEITVRPTMRELDIEAAIARAFRALRTREQRSRPARTTVKAAAARRRGSR